MAQTTLVRELSKGEQRELEERLKAGRFEWRSVPHAAFQVRGEGVVATLYTSGKFVVQGAEADGFALRYLKDAPAAAPASPARLAADPVGPDVVRIGSDETGKGDYFGPLVVAAVRLEPGEAAELATSDVADSKTLTDKRIAKLAPALMGRYAHAIERLDPPDYNRERARLGNLNPLLADLHARAIRRLLEGREDERVDVLVDKFAAEGLMRERLAGCNITLRQRPRAEDEVAVAAASVIARYAFVERLAELSEEYAVELRKGAGAPTDAAGRRFLAMHGVEALGNVAKLHFKNTDKIGGLS
jgi:ribonuclease HIII